MINLKHFAALLGFAFAAAWIGFGFGHAVLCLVGAGVFYFAASYVEGGVDLGELQARFGSNAASRPATAPAPAGARSRVR